MKKILFAAMIAVLTIGLVSVTAEKAKAQSTYKTTGTDTLSNTDTTIMYLYSTTLNTPSKVRSIQATVKGVSGTAGGYVLLQGTNDRLVWKDVNTDTLTVTGLTVGTYQSKVWPTVSSAGYQVGTTYAAYRLWYKQTGTATSILIGTLLRRSDE